MSSHQIDSSHLADWLREELAKPTPADWSDEYTHGYDDALCDLIGRLDDLNDPTTAPVTVDVPRVGPWTADVWVARHHLTGTI